MVRSQPTPNLLFVVFMLLFLAMSQLAISQPVLGLDKKGKQKRIHFYEGDRISVKLVSKEKVSGVIDAIYDSSFVVQGRKIELQEVAKVYSTRPAVKYIGGALVVAGVFYLSIDAINNTFNSRGYVFSNTPITYTSMAAVGTGLVLMYFGTRRTDVHEKGNFRIFNPTPIAIKEDSIGIQDSTIYCPNGEQAVLTKLDLDGCDWVLLLQTGEKLQPMNIYDFLTEEQIEKGEAFKVRVEYYETKSASICMVGKTVAIKCWEVLK